MAYQQVLTKFGRLPKLRLEPKLSCRDLLMLQMSREEYLAAMRVTANTAPAPQPCAFSSQPPSGAGELC